MHLKTSLSLIRRECSSAQPTSEKDSRESGEWWLRCPESSGCLPGSQVVAEQNWANRKAGAEEARTPVQVLEGRSFNADTKPVAGTLKPSVVVTHY